MLAGSLSTARAHRPADAGWNRAGTNGDGVEPPIAITSDTRAFCDLLAGRVRDAPRKTVEMQRLLVQGETMCRAGAVREGLFRLRQALLQEEDAGPVPHS